MAKTIKVKGYVTKSGKRVPAHTRIQKKEAWKPAKTVAEATRRHDARNAELEKIRLANMARDKAEYETKEMQDKGASHHLHKKTEEKREINRHSSFAERMKHYKKSKAKDKKEGVRGDRPFRDRNE